MANIYAPNYYSIIIDDEIVKSIGDRVSILVKKCRDYQKLDNVQIIAIHSGSFVVAVWGKALEIDFRDIKFIDWGE